MFKWLLEFLDIDINDVFVGKTVNEEIYGGYIISRSSRYYINKGILVYFNKRNYAKYRRIIIAYRLIPPDFWRENKSDWYIHLRKFHKTILLEGIKKLDKTSLNILSIGCGSGWEIWTLSKYLQTLSKDYKIIGCDIALKPLQVAWNKARRQKHNNIDFICCSAETLPFKDNTFDLVTAIFGALDHSINYVRSFIEAARVLKSGGIFVATVINRFALEWILKVIRNPRLFIKTIKFAGHTHARIRIPLGGHYISIPTHFYNALEIKQILDRAGLQRKKFLGVFIILPLNFKRKKFSRLDQLLSKIDKHCWNIPILNYLGRYIGIIAQKVS